MLNHSPRSSLTLCILWIEYTESIQTRFKKVHTCHEKLNSRALVREVTKNPKINLRSWDTCVEIGEGPPSLQPTTWTIWLICLLFYCNIKHNEGLKTFCTHCSCIHRNTEETDIPENKVIKKRTKTQWNQVQLHKKENEKWNYIQRDEDQTTEDGMFLLAFAEKYCQQKNVVCVLLGGLQANVDKITEIWNESSISPSSSASCYDQHFIVRLKTWRAR